MAPPYSYLLRRCPPGVARVVIVHNALPHESVPFAAPITRSVLSQADLLVAHAAEQVDELRSIGLERSLILPAFHPRFSAADLSALPEAAAVASERDRQGNPEISLLAFGAIRPYKGIDLALDALALLDRSVRVRLTVAGVFWDGGASLREQVSRLGLEDRVELRDGFVSNEEAALMFTAADASLLPYRSATQSGVVQLSFAYRTPVIATAVGGLPEAIDDGVDGLLVPPEDPAALAAAVQRLPQVQGRLAQGIERTTAQSSFARYAELVSDVLDALPSRRRRPSRPLFAVRSVQSRPLPRTGSDDAGVPLAAAPAHPQRQPVAGHRRAA
jgi:glycosyltransferase involved in cell wall biosynthesis